MRAVALLLLLLALTGCGAMCQTEQAAVNGLREITATLDADSEERTLAEEELTAAEAALESCLAEEEGEWCRMIMLLVMKTAAEVLATR